MHSVVWMNVLRMMPPEFQDNLVIRTVGGSEINVQSLLRMEGDYLVVRGRMAGSTQDNKPFFVPFDQIDFLTFYRPVKDAAIKAMYGEPVPPNVLEGEAEAQETQETPPAEAPPAAAAPTPSLTPTTPSLTRPMASKPAMLDRLRNRPPGAPPPSQQK